MLGVKPGELLTIESRRGKVSLYGRADETSPRGAVFVPFCYYEAAVNRVSPDALDAEAKIRDRQH
jgi:formate dehydrogenase major subunit